MMTVLGGELVEGRPKHVITIGQLAGFAGVTIKAVRHYHQRGLLADPPRDSSGYRRYSAEHAIDLVKIKTLADAGVPPARITALLAADPGIFPAAIAQSDRNLAGRARRCARRRRVRSGDGAAAVQDPAIAQLVAARAGGPARAGDGLTETARRPRAGG